MATVSEMQSFVRIHADADVEDAPNETLEVYARIAYNDILSRRNGWPHLMVEGELLTVPNQDAYDLSAVTGVTTSLDLVLSVMDQNTLGRRLVFMTQSVVVFFKERFKFCSDHRVGNIQFGEQSLFMSFE